MTTIIAGLALELPERYIRKVGDPCDKLVTDILVDIFIQRLHSRATYWLNKHPTASAADLQAEVDRLAAEFKFDDEPPPDLIEEEAILIAGELISAKLATDGLPPPRDLRAHAEQLADDPALRAQAKARVLARTRVARDLLDAAQ